MTARLAFAIWDERCQRHGCSSGIDDLTGRCLSCLAPSLCRYFLSVPTSHRNNRAALGIFANPSTATPLVLDRTLTRWRNYCQTWGYGWSWTMNVDPWRSTDSKAMRDGDDSRFANNTRIMRRMIPGADLIVCGWGELEPRRGPGVLALVRELGRVPMALGINKSSGSPTHPLYLSAKLLPMVMS